MPNPTKSQSKSKDLTEGPVWKNLFSLAWPMVFGIIAVMSISIVDSYFIGQLGTKPLAAISFTFPVALTIMSLAIGLSAGAASIVSRAKGAKDPKKVKRTSTDSLLLSFVFVIIICIIGFLTIRPLFGLMGAEGETLNMIERYMRIWYASMPLLVIPMVVNGLIRSTGDSLWPSLMMMGSATINVILTPIFINGYGPLPAFDIEGAAIATAIAYACTFVFSLYLLIVREKMVSFTIPPCSEIWDSWKEIFQIALPAAAGNATNPFAIGVVTSFIASYGDNAVAAFGPATRVESFATIVMLALSSAIGPVSGQNWGAGHKDRVIEAQKVSFIICFIWSALLAVLLYFISPYIANAFSENATVQDEIALYLTIIPISLWGYGVTIIAAGCYNAIGKPLIGLNYYAIRSIFLYIPLCWLAVQFFDEPFYVYIAIAMANLIGGLLIAYHAIKKLKN